MKKVRDNTAVPAVHWRYINAEDGFELSDGYFNRLKKAVVEYRSANHYPIGLLFNEEFEENICSHAPDHLCLEFTPPSLLEKMTAVGQALAKAAMSWRHPLVTAEELDRRRNICGECNFFGGSKTLLKVACKKCGCTGLKLALVSSHCPLPQPKW